MPVENPEEKTVEVLALPSDVDEELLFLYFENKRRSGGGPLLSVEKKGDRALLVFEEAEAAAGVLSKRAHVLHNVELSVRKPASKDRCRLLLRGINPNTSTEMLELYVENKLGLNAPDYSLSPSPGSDLILIHLSQPLTKDFQSLSSKVSEKMLDGAKVTLEQIEQTDSVVVENLHPGTTSDQLTAHFESQEGGNQKVKDVTMLSEGSARVSFVNFDSVDLVLDQRHKVNGADLAVKPYFDFLQPAQSLTAQDSGNRSQTSEDLSDTPMQTSPPVVVCADSRPSSQRLPANEAEAAEEAMEGQTEDVATLSSHIPVADRVKLALFERSTFQQDVKKAHPDFTVQIKDDGVHIAGPGRENFEQIKRSILDYFGNMADTHLTLKPEEVQFLGRKDVKDRLLQTMIQSESPAVYSVSDCSVTVTSLSANSAKQACSFLKSQLCHFSLQVDEYECMLYCREWSEFLQGLDFAAVKASERGGNVDVLTLKGMEAEKRTSILEFLSTPIERETVISMEPGVLKYIQTHCHQLLADMDQVSIFPLEAEDVCGLKIHGPAIACQMAEEVLQGVVSSVCFRAVKVSAPGVTRFFEDDECKSIMKEMERKFQVFIIPKYVPWQPLPHQDFFKVAWTLMSHKNFQRVSSDHSADSVQTDQNGAVGQGLLEEAKRIVSSIDERPKDGVSGPDQPEDMDNVDLYTADEPSSPADQDLDVIPDDPSPLSAEQDAANVLPLLSDGAVGLASSLEEEAQLSLAIQYSMESSNWYLEDEEKQLQKALELSKIMSEGEASSSDNIPPVDTQQKGVSNSIQDDIKAASTMQLEVFAGYACDSLRVEIAFGKKVSQRQVVEKLERSTVRNMSEYHKMCLEVIKRKHAVEVEVQGTIISVSGFKDFVYGGMLDVKLLVEKLSNSVSDREILKSVQWVYHDPVSSLETPYAPDATVFIENVYRMKLDKIDILFDNQPHTINFEKMLEYNLSSGKSVQVSRKLVDLGDLVEELEETEYSLLSNLPEASKVDEESDEFQNVVKNFYETIQEYHSKIRIIQVEKLMNRLLYNQYKLKKASILQTASYKDEIERTLYHGTSETSVKEICIHGFNRSFCGKNATVYGQGVYFAVNSALSVQDQYSPPNANGHKFIIVSKVLTGDYTKGCHSMKAAPLKDTGDIPLRYDSVTDDINKPSMFVIFNDTQAFPEYLITCQKIHR